MNQQTFDQIIKAGQVEEISVELMAAAQDSARQYRSEALRHGIHWMKKKIISAFNRPTGKNPYSRGANATKAIGTGAICVSAVGANLIAANEYSRESITA